MSDGDRSFHRQQLDQRLLIPKLEELAQEMQKRSIEANNKAGSATRTSGNTASYFPRLFEAQRQLTEEWAQRVYDVHCEVWRIQGNTVTPEFIRTVGEKAVTELIATRKGAVESAAELWCKRNRHGGHIPLGSWARTIIELRSRWVNRLEAEAVAGEYRSIKGSAKPTNDTMANPVDSSFKKRVAISNAPPPPTVLSGTSWIPRQPKLTEVLDHLPPYYPTSLNAKTHLIICEAVKKFPLQTSVAELCKYVITKATPLFRKVILESALRQDRALSEVSDLIESLLVHNCDSDSRRYELQKELRRSDEWLRFAKIIAGSRSRRVGPENARQENAHGTEQGKARSGQNQSAGAKKNRYPIFSASGDYCSITYNGVSHTLTRNQSTIIKLLHEAYLKGTPSLRKDALLAAIGAETSRVRDSFKGSQLWGTLIVSNDRPRGTYRLNLE
jgi:hypothetical protein